MAIPAALAAQLTPEQLAVLEAAMAPSAFGQYPQPIPQQMLPYTPSVTDRIRMGASDLFGNDPVGRRRQGMVNRSVDNLTPLPVLDILRVAQEQYDRGAFGSAAANTAMAAIGVTPVGKVSRPMRSIRGSKRQKFPGIYKEPEQLVQEANAMVAPESGAMQRLFGVDRQDLYDIGSTRPGNQLVDLPGMPANPKGTAHGRNVMEKRNERRLVNALEANRGTPLEQGMTGWYVMDPVYQRLEELLGPDQAKIEYNNLNTLIGLQSPQSDVLTELKRGTAANFLNKQGRFDDFMAFGGMSASAREKMGSAFPADMLKIPGHTGHKTSAGIPTRKFLETGSAQQTSPKVPAYIQASSVPEVGFQTSFPVGDAHFSRGIGLTDVRPEKKTDMFSSWSMPEAAELAPWFREQIARQAGYEAVPAQANLWGLLGPQTGVDTQIGAPKLELLSDLIMDTSKRLKVSPEDARDMVLTGQTHAGFATPEMLAALSAAGLTGAALMRED